VRQVLAARSRPEPSQMCPAGASLRRLGKPRHGPAGDRASGPLDSPLVPGGARLNARPPNIHSMAALPTRLTCRDRLIPVFRPIRRSRPLQVRLFRPPGTQDSPVSPARASRNRRRTFSARSADHPRHGAPRAPPAAIPPDAS
jgi:hypothetical protein